MRQGVGRRTSLGNGAPTLYVIRMAQLTDRAVIALSGPESHAFLQGLVTNDVNAVAPGKPVYAALLTPQGKILFDFLVHDADGVLLIDCRKASREALAKRLTMYKLRAKLDVTPRDDLMVVTEGPADPRLAALGSRSIAKGVPGEPGDDTYHARRLDLGVPEGEDFGSDRMFALDAGLDELHAVSFEKGCYVGQELTARMKHRGKDRKRLLPVATADGKPLPARDVPVTGGRVEIGTIISAYGPRGFALLRLDRLESSGAPLEAAGVPVIVTKPGWLFT
jgi:tRNA-modifying protein YgfZ